MNPRTSPLKFLDSDPNVSDSELAEQKNTKYQIDLLEQTEKGEPSGEMLTYSNI